MKRAEWQWFLWFLGFMGLFLGTCLCAVPVVAKCLLLEMPSDMTVLFNWQMVVGSGIGLVACVWWMGRGQYLERRGGRQ